MLVSSCFYFSINDSFQGQVVYHLKESSGVKNVVLTFEDRWCWIKEERQDNWAPHYKVKNTLCNMGLQACWEQIGEGESFFPVWNSLGVEPQQVRCDTLAGVQQILGYDCIKYQISYKEKVNGYGTTLVFDELWVVPRLMIPKVSRTNTLHMLVANEIGCLPLKLKRTIETISFSEETFNFSKTYIAQKVQHYGKHK